MRESVLSFASVLGGDGSLMNGDNYVADGGFSCSGVEHCSSGRPWAVPRSSARLRPCTLVFLLWDFTCVPGVRLVLKAMKPWLGGISSRERCGSCIAPLCAVTFFFSRVCYTGSTLLAVGICPTDNRFSIASGTLVAVAVVASVCVSARKRCTAHAEVSTIPKSELVAATTTRTPPASRAEATTGRFFRGGGSGNSEILRVSKASKVCPRRCR